MAIDGCLFPLQVFALFLLAVRWMLGNDIEAVVWFVPYSSLFCAIQELMLVGFFDIFSLYSS